MEYNPNPVEVVPAPVQTHRKDATTAMVCGIIGLVLAWWGVSTIAALILAIIAFVKAKKNRAFALNMGIPESGQNKAGYICGLVGIILSAIILFFLILFIVVLCVFGAALLGNELPGFIDSLPGFIDGIQSSLAALPLFLTAL